MQLGVGSISATHGPYSAHTKGHILPHPVRASHARAEKQSDARGEGRGETVEIEQLDPLGDAGGFLTPGNVCSSPSAPPDRQNCNAAFSAPKIWQRERKNEVF